MPERLPLGLRALPPKGCDDRPRCPMATQRPLHLRAQRSRRPSATSLPSWLPGPPAPLKSCLVAKGDGQRGKGPPGGEGGPWPLVPRARHKHRRRKEENFPPLGPAASHPGPPPPQSTYCQSPWSDQRLRGGHPRLGDPARSPACGALLSRPRALGGRAAHSPSRRAPPPPPPAPPPSGGPKSPVRCRAR